MISKTKPPTSPAVGHPTVHISLLMGTNNMQAINHQIPDPQQTNLTIAWNTFLDITTPDYEPRMRLSHDAPAFLLFFTSFMAYITNLNQ